MLPKRSHHAKLPHDADGTSKLITTFFAKPPPPPQVGRPAGLPLKKRGPRPASSAAASMPAVSELSGSAAASTSEPSETKLGKRAAADLVGAKLKRTNWGHGDNLKLMTKAVHDWDAKTGTHLEKDNKMSLPSYAVCVGINYQTLADYCCKDHGKRKQQGISVGAPTLFSEDEQQFAVDVVRRHDRGNDGLSKRECVDILHDLQPGAKRASVSKGEMQHMQQMQQREMQQMQMRLQMQQAAMQQAAQQAVQHAAQQAAQQAAQHAVQHAAQQATQQVVQQVVQQVQQAAIQTVRVVKEAHGIERIDSAMQQAQQQQQQAQQRQQRAQQRAQQQQPKTAPQRANARGVHPGPKGGNGLRPKSCSEDDSWDAAFPAIRSLVEIDGSRASVSASHPIEPLLNPRACCVMCKRVE